MLFIILALIVIVITVFILFLINKKKEDIPGELQKEIHDFMSEINDYDINQINMPVKEDKEITDTLDLNDLFKTMSISIAKDDTDFDFGLLKRNTKK